MARWVARERAANLLDISRLAIAGDSVGGTMSAALALLAKEPGDVSFVLQVLFCPATDATFDTASYRQL